MHCERVCMSPMCYLYVRMRVRAGVMRVCEPMRTCVLPEYRAIGPASREAAHISPST